jgi:hypothetical protein
VFVVNYDLTRSSGYFGIPALDQGVVLTAEFSTSGPVDEIDRRLVGNGYFHRLEDLAPGEGRAYRIERPPRGGGA